MSKINTFKTSFIVGLLECVKTAHFPDIGIYPTLNYSAVIFKFSVYKHFKKELHPELQVVFYSRIQWRIEDVARLTSSYGRALLFAMIEHISIVTDKQPIVIEFSTQDPSKDYDLSIQEDLSEVPRFDLDLTQSHLCYTFRILFQRFLATQLEQS